MISKPGLIWKPEGWGERRPTRAIRKSEVLATIGLMVLFHGLVIWLLSASMGLNPISENIIWREHDGIRRPSFILMWQSKALKICYVFQSATSLSGHSNSYIIWGL